MGVSETTRGSRPPNSELYPWYDSQWLTKYSRAKETIRRVKPAALPGFVEALRVFQTRPDFQVGRFERVFDEDVLREIRRVTASLRPADLELHEARTFGRFVVHDHPFFTELQQRAEALVSETAGEAVEASYNFLSLYRNRGVCPPHLDAPSAKWTLDLCVNQSAPWPIYFSQVVSWPERDTEAWPDEQWEDRVKQSPLLQFTPHTLEPGQAVVFSGSSQWHYRDAIADPRAGYSCDLLFFHFIPSGTRGLLEPKNWARLFGVPELRGDSVDEPSGHA